MHLEEGAVSVAGAGGGPGLTKTAAVEPASQAHELEEAACALLHASPLAVGFMQR